jgi:hypothetical protein
VVNGKKKLTQQKTKGTGEMKSSEVELNQKAQELQSTTQQVDGHRQSRRWWLRETLQGHM